MGAQNITSKEQFTNEVLKSESLVLVDFWAEWCGPCKALLPKLDEVATEASEKVKVFKVNVDEHSELSSEYKVRGVPMLLFFKNGEPIDQLMGNQAKDAIIQKIDALQSS